MIIYGEDENGALKYYYHLLVPTTNLHVHPDIENITIVITKLSKSEYEVTDGTLALGINDSVSCTNSPTSDNIIANLISETDTVYDVRLLF